MVGEPDGGLQRALSRPDLSAVLGGLLSGEVDQFHLQRGTGGSGRGASRLFGRAVLRRDALGVPRRALIDVDQAQQRSVGEEPVLAQAATLLFAEFDRAYRSAPAQVILQAAQEHGLSLGHFPFGGLERLRLAGDPLQALLDQGDVGEGQFEGHRFDVTDRIDALHRVWDGVVLERPHDVNQRVHPAQLVQEARLRAGAATETSAREVHVLQCRLGVFLGLEHRAELVEAEVGDFDDAEMRILVGGDADLMVRGRDGVEKRRFAAALKANDAQSGHSRWPPLLAAAGRQFARRASRSISISPSPACGQSFSATAIASTEAR